MTNLSINNSITELTISKYVNKVSSDFNLYLSSLQSILVSEENSVFHTVEGVLFKTDELILYPSSKSGTSYEIPDNIKILGSYAFANAKNLLSIIHPQQLDLIRDYAYYNMLIISSIKIPSSVTEIGLSIFSKMNEISSLEVPFIGRKYSSTSTEYLLSYFFGSEEFENSYPIDQGNGVRYIPLSFNKLIVQNSKDIASTIFKGFESIQELYIRGENLNSITASALRDLINLNVLEVPFIGTSSAATDESSVFGAIFGYIKQNKETVISGTTYQYKKTG